MPEFELDLRNVESEVVDGVTVIKAAELTAVSLVGLSAEEAAANLHANAAAIARAAREAEPKRLAERPSLEVIGNGYLRRCAHCDYNQVTHVGVTAEAQHVCHRDGVMYLIMWPRG